MPIDAELIDLDLKEPFRISKGEVSRKTTCILTLEDALGECCPSIYYGYSAEDCHREIKSARIEANYPFELSRRLNDFEIKYGERKSLLAGIDIVLHDYISRHLELPLYQYLGLPAPFGKETSYTISIDSPDNLPNRLKLAADFKSVKVKIGSPHDRENMQLIKDQGRHSIRVDANGAFTLKEFMELAPFLNSLEIELVEQPLKESSPHDLRELRRILNAPIFLDESIIEIEDIFRYVDAVDGINIKLQRVGGIRIALKMIQVAKSIGMKIMLGCMLETAIGNSAAAQLAGFADFLDLDSSQLIKNDPFEGITIEQGSVVIPERNGIGVQRRKDA